MISVIAHLEVTEKKYLPKHDFSTGFNGSLLFEIE
jgi:hypothetical protein